MEKESCVVTTPPFFNIVTIARVMGAIYAPIYLTGLSCICTDVGQNYLCYCNPFCRKCTQSKSPVCDGFKKYI